MVRQFVAPALFVLLALSGCTGGGGHGGDGDDDLAAGLDQLDLDATDTTGIIRGVVVNEAIVPIPGVSITATSSGVNVTTQTNADGLFGLDGLEPGTYFVFATKAGFLPAQTSAEVVAGDDDPKSTKITLAVDQASRPYFTQDQYSAFIGCSVTSPSVSAAVCGLPVLADLTNNGFLKNYRADRPPSWIQMEAIWDSTQPLGGELSLSVTSLGPPQITVNTTDGKSPIFITINETMASAAHFGVNDTDITMRLFSTELTGTDVVPEEVVHAAYASSVYPTLNGTPVASTYQSVVVDNDPFGLAVNPFSNPDCIQYPVLFAACYAFGGAGVVVNQRVEVYTHIFYGYTPTPGWRFSDNSQVPTPP